MTITPDADIRSFFSLFERAGGAGDTEALAGCFAETFLAGDADGASPVPREAFLAALPARTAAAAARGIGPAHLTSLDVVQLDDHWLVARTRWNAPREGADGMPMASTFLLHRRADGLRIVAYLNHEGLGVSPTAPGQPASQAPAS